MLNLLHRVLGREVASKEIAKERLRLVLVQDRASVSPQFLEMLRQEIVRVVSEYMEIDDKAMDVSLTSHDNTAALVASIPIKRLKRPVRT